ncbi:MAG: DNA replication/repair protein RecF, partial [Gemmatimonadales bacterium]
MRRLSVRGFRNLRDADLEFPSGGVALLGPNGQGKTNLLEAIHYPVVFRSMRGAPDPEVLAFGQAAFRVDLTFETGGRTHTAAVSYQQEGRKKRITVDSAETRRAAEVAGTWLAVAFQPGDVTLASGPAAVRRRYLDRMLALADRHYLGALLRYRAALEQRNAALRQGAGELARAFDDPLAAAGSRLMSARLAWVRDAADSFRAELESLGESEPLRLDYGGAPELVAPEAWSESLER